LKDWADLGSLIDTGVEVHFANESLDLNSRGGRLSADIQAVVAADYIRNLREETRKGIYGRLRQGLYPFPVRVGYLDTGKGSPKKLAPFKRRL
jgi:DNA invertase Pin-like site-specific DNA recombinase